MKRAASKCLFCGAPATLLCDGIIGWDADEDDSGIIQKARGMYTCDAPLCRDCATWHGNIFFSGRAGGMETTDYCPLCEALFQAGDRIRTDPRRADKAIKEPCLTDEQARIIRLAHWNSRLNKHRREMHVLNGGGQQCLDF